MTVLANAFFGTQKAETTGIKEMTGSADDHTCGGKSQSRVH
ncbi:hypothetical protein [Morganella morganii IS15]|nr:hypothetical protein [Morganella morganii IS15]